MKSIFTRWLDSDIGFSFRSSPVAVGAAVVALICLLGALLAPWLAPHNPMDLTTLELSDARLPPAWEAEGRLRFVLGTDDQVLDLQQAHSSPPLSAAWG